MKVIAGITASSYCSSVISWSTWSCPYCKKYAPDGKLIVTFATPKYDLSGFLLRVDSQKTIYLVFRGTFSVENFFVDIALTKTAYTPVSNARIHKGFYDAYNNVALYFYSQFLSQHAAYPDYNVLVSGHSLGAAEALIAGIDLYQRIETLNTNNLKIYTYGCPRVGDENFAKYVKSTGISVTRSVHKRDVVPHVPSQLLGYLHTGQEIWEKPDSNDIVICNGDFEDTSCSASVPLTFTNTDDHLKYYDVREGSCTTFLLP